MLDLLEGMGVPAGSLRPLLPWSWAWMLQQSACESPLVSVGALARLLVIMTDSDKQQFVVK